MATLFAAFPGGVLASAPMRRVLFCFFLVNIINFGAGVAAAGDLAELKQRRLAAAHEFADGLLLLRADSTFRLTADGYRENPPFYYLTGLENVQGAFFALDGRTGESWLFLSQGKEFLRFPVAAELALGGEAEKKLGIDHVEDWLRLETLLSARARLGEKIYYVSDAAALPNNLSGTKDSHAPAWIQVLQLKWPAIPFQSAGDKLAMLMAVQSPSEERAVRAAADATTKALLAGMGAIRPGVSQRSVELAVVNGCWRAGAHGVSFWPWAMAGANSVFPAPFASLSRYDHLNAEMHTGDLVRLDVGCEVDHYQGDLGRTLPVSGRYTEEQREIWNIFVAAYQVGVKELREGATEDHIFEVWKAELQRHLANVKTPLAKEAVADWSDRKNVPFWEVHSMNLDAGPIGSALKAGMTVDFEPIAAIGGQGYYLEDMFLITKTGAEVLTPGLPYTAEEIEAQMAGSPPQLNKSR
jgi:Xaa-Pro aminopeptidase